MSIVNADVEEGPCRNVGSPLKSMVRLTSGMSRQLISSMGTLCLCIIWLSYIIQEGREAERDDLKSSRLGHQVLDLSLCESTD